MKPSTIILTISAIALCATAYGQQWVGELFDLDTTVGLSADHLPEDLSHLKCCVCEGTFYYTEMQAYQREGKDHAAVIQAVRLDEWVPYSFTLSMPRTVTRRDEAASQYWIHDFSIGGGRAVVSTQDDILLYTQQDTRHFEFDTLFHHPNIKSTYIYKDTLYLFEEEHNTGYKWFCRPLKGGRERLVRELRYEAPHVVQASPNRYLFHDEEYVYFLSTRYPILHRYTLDGALAEEIVFELPNWHPFEDEYIRQSLTVPYGIERIHATMGDIWRYSYPKYVFPLDDGYLLYYTQYDTTTGKSHLQYAFRDATGTVHLYSVRDTSIATYTGGRFPFNLFDREEDKAHISCNDQLIEICVGGDVPWDGLFPTEFKHQQEAYYRRNEPVIQIRTMRHKNNRIETRAAFYDRDKHLLALQNLPEGRNVLLFNPALNCSACRHALLQLLNTTDTNYIHIGILYDYIPGALQEREMDKEIRKYLGRPYSLYFLAGLTGDPSPRLTFNNGEPFQAGILMYERGKAPIFYNLDQIFTDEGALFRLSPSFVQEWNTFTQSP